MKHVHIKFIIAVSQVIVTLHNRHTSILIGSEYGDHLC